VTAVRVVARTVDESEVVFRVVAVAVGVLLVVVSVATTAGWRGALVT
jgi:hypothetical protein